MTYSIAFLLQFLYSIYGIGVENQFYKETLNNDPQIAKELGIDPNCPDCDLDLIKLRINELEDRKANDGGITGDDFAGS